MERIIYNTKLKKLFIAIIIFMILCNFIFPNVVMAEPTNDGEIPDVTITCEEETIAGRPYYTYYAVGSPQDLFDSMDIYTGGTREDNTLKTIADILVGMGYSESPYVSDQIKYGDIEPTIISYIEENIKNDFNEDLEKNNIKAGELAKKIYEDNKQNRETIESTLLIKYVQNYGLTIQVNKVKTNITLTSEDISEGIAKVQEEEENESDAGGILLSPFFWLMNFITDAITSNLGSIMTGHGLTLSGTFKVLRANKTPLKKGKEYYEPKIDMNKLNVIGTIQYPNIVYTPEEIFSGEIDLLSIDFISGKDTEGNENKDEGWLNIRKVISQWYQVLRMIAIVGLLSVLIYTGIKIIISANAKDKAKYKEWIINWLMAVAILFFMHYIMAFIISVTGELSKLISNASQGIAVDGPDGLSATNLFGLVRYMIQAENFSMKVGYEVMYVALLWYTIKFTFIYLKRVLNMAFLTLIAPIVALTYPIDKMNDGQAQGFNMWLKEYIFNALLQPMHCILYYVLVGSAVSIAAENPIYGIVVLMFMTEAERLLKKIFGFDKATGGTVGGMASAFAAGAIASNISKMFKLPKGNGGKGGDGANGIDNDLYKNLSATNKDSGDDLFDHPVEGGNGPEVLGEGRNGHEAREGDSDRNSRQQTPGYGMSYDDQFMPPEEWEGEQEQLRREEEARANALNSNNPDNSSNPNNPDNSENPNNPDNSTQPTRSSTDQIMQDYEDRDRQRIEQMSVTPEPSRKPIREIAKQAANSKFARGMGNVGKKLLKPVWDLDHKGKEGAKYNAKRLVRKIGRAAVGAGLGIGAAAVQAGISITDGKYNPAEGVAAFVAGYAGGGQITKGFGGLVDSYKEGTLPDDPNDRKQEKMKRAKKTWEQRDDVIKHNNNKYAKEERKSVMNIQQQLLEQGVTDIKEMDNCIKYIKSSNNGSLEGVSPDMVKKARVMHDFTEDANVSKVMFDPNKRKDYINTVAKDDRERRILENKFNEAVNYHNIINKK